MADPQKPDRRLQSMELQRQQGAAGRETNRPTDSTPVANSQFAQLPTAFGRYQVERLLGRGAMGSVYLALDTQLNRRVALKIPKVAASGSKRLLQRLQTEAQAAAQLDHPSLCKVYDAGEVNGQCFIAMQFIEGETLKSQLETHSKSIAEAVSLIVQLAEGLSEAHELGIIHRDIKPENIMINRRGVPVIMDFGLAKFSTMTGNAAATQAGTILGSPAYMSPEQASGNTQEIDQRSDIYALGTILYELLTGEWPFNGSAMQILGQKSLLEPTSPLTIRPDLPPRLAAICSQMIAKENVDRYQTLGDVIADLTETGIALQTAANPSSSAILARSRPVPSEIDGVDLPDQRTTSIRKRRSASAARPPRAVAPTAWQQVTDVWNRQSQALRWTAFCGGGLLCIMLVLTVTKKRGVNRETKTEVAVASPQVEPALPAAETKQLPPAPAVADQAPAGEPMTVNDTMAALPATAPVPDIPEAPVAAPAAPSQNALPRPAPTIAPFNRQQAVRYQQDWANYLGVPVSWTNSIGMTFRLLPPGEYLRGYSQSDLDRLESQVPRLDPGWLVRVRQATPQHKVILDEPLYIGRFEVTQREYQAVMGQNPSGFAKGSDLDWAAKAVANLDTESFPVERVSWFDAAEFCSKLSQREQLRPFYRANPERTVQPDGNGYRLPTEAEWEYACRAGTTTRYWFGDTDEELLKYGWYGSNSVGRIHAAGYLPANPFGLNDMHGNLWEWVQDAWNPDAYSRVVADGTLRNPQTVPSGLSRRVSRGGAWGIHAFVCSSAFRLNDDPALRNDGIGFRACCTVEAVLASIKRGSAATGADSQSTASVPAVPLIPSNAATFRSKSYQLYKDVLTWHAAQKKCAELGGRLAEIKSGAENNFVKNLALKHQVDGVWLGATDEVRMGRWLWSDGTELTYQNWNAEGKQPTSAAANERYLCMQINTSPGEWRVHTAHATKLKLAYVCEWDAPQAAGKPQPAATQVWKSVFNGKDLSGWTPYLSSGPTHEVQTPVTNGWVVQDGELVCDTNTPGWLRLNEIYGDAEIQFEFLMPAGTNSGLVFRYPGTGSITKSSTTYEVQLDSDPSTPNIKGRCGAIYNVVAPSHNVYRVNRWNEMSVRLLNNRISIRMNDQQIVEANVSYYRELRDLPATGYFGILNDNVIIGRGRGCRFRNIRVKSLSKP